MVAELLSGAGMRALVQNGRAKFTHVDPENFLELPPGAFIAVRRRKAEDATRYAQSVRAYLSATYSRALGRAQGFATSPVALHWSAVPRRVWEHDKRTSCDYQIVESLCLVNRPLSVRQEDLRNSWRDGTPLVNGWSLNGSEPLSRCLLGPWKALSGLRRRIRDSAVVLSRAMESTDPVLLTLFAAVAVERLFDAGGGFQELEELACSLFTGENGRKEIAALLSQRHGIAHKAETPDASEKPVQLLVAWVLLFGAAVIAEYASSVDEFIEHLRHRVDATRVAKHLRGRGKTELAAEVEREATFVGPPSK